MSYPYLSYLRRALLAASLIPLSACSSASEGIGATDGQTSFGETEPATTGDTSSSSSTQASASAGSTSGDPYPSTGGSSTTGSDTSESDTDPLGDAVPGYGDDDDDSEVCDDQLSTTLELDLPDSNAMVSPVQARMAVLDGWGIFGNLFIRPWEFLAYYPFDYAPAPAGQVNVKVELFAPKDLPEGSYELQVGIAGPAMSAAQRPPLDLTLVLDVSGSMQGVPLTILRDACLSLLGELRSGDRVSLVTWNSEEPVLLAHHTVSGPLDPSLVSVIDNLEATGGSDLFAGLSAGYDLAAQIYDPQRVSRVLLMSDGGAAADSKALALIEEHALDQGDAEGIYLIGIGVGTYGGYQPALMDSVATVGAGPTLFIGSKDEATATLGERFLGHMFVAARDLKVEVTLPPGFRRRLPEEFTYGIMPIDSPGQPLRQNESLVYYERLASCTPGSIADESPLSVKVHYRDASSFEEKDFVVHTTFGELLSKGVTHLHKGAAIVRYSEALRLWNEAPGAPDAYINAAEAALGRAALAQTKLPQDESLEEIQFVLEALLDSLK